MPRISSSIFLYALSVIVLLSSCNNVKKTEEHKEIRKGANSYINPLLDCYDLSESTLSEMKLLEDKIEKHIKKAIDDNSITSCSVYFRDLNNGPWIGINEDELYAPASLLKVPFMMAALRQAEEDPGFLSRKITYYPENSQLVQNIYDKGFRLIPGKTYSIDELINFMIIYSDNASKDILLSNLPLTIFNEAFHDLGIEIEKYGIEDNFLSVKDYATYFRMLYNATYLSKYMSNKALEMLSKSVYKNGIAGGVPGNIVIAHKFGERTFFNSNMKQLHDCGIVYKGNSPYLICIMVKGTDFGLIEKTIQDISKVVYDAVEV